MLKNRIRWMDVLRSIGIILVVLGHVSINKNLVDWIYSFHMPLFFFTSGWLYQKREIISDIRHRAVKILVPYLLFAIVDLVYWALVERHFRASEITVLQGLLGIILGHYNLLAFNVHLWFLPCFFVVSVLYNILRYKWNQHTVVLVSVGLTMVAILVSLPDMIWSINRVLLYIGYFALGDWVSEWKTEMWSGIDKKYQKLLIGSLLWILVFFLLPLQKSTVILQMAVALLGISGSIAIAMALEDIKILQNLGKTTLVILCIHGPIYRVLVKITSMIVHMDAESLRQNILICLIITSITCVFCVMIYHILKHFAPWFLGDFCLNRRKNTNS